MANEIKIIIGGDAQQFQKAATQTTTSLVGIGKAATSASTALNKTTPAVKQAGGALTDVNRVIQDLPFGFVAIQNNLTQLPESFKSLSRAAKESGQSIGGVLLKSLTGAGGIGFALSIVTSALAFATNGFGAWTRGLTSSGGAAKKAKEETEEFSKILQDAAQEAAKDATRVTTLFNALSSGTLSFEERKSALKELQSINKEFFGSLREEKGIIEGLEVAYQGYLDKVIQIGRAKAIETQLTKLFDKKLQLELTIDPKFIASTDPNAQRFIGKLKKELESLGGAVDLNKEKFDVFNKTQQRRIELQQKINQNERAVFSPDASRQIRATQKEIELLDLRIKGLSELQQATGEFDIKQEKASNKEEDSLKKRLAALEKIRDATKDITTQASLQQEIFDLQVQITLRDAAKNGLSKQEVDLAIQGFKNELQEAFDKESLSLEAIPKVKVTNVELDRSTDEPIESKIAKATGVDKKIDVNAREVRIRLLGIKVVEAEERAKEAIQRLKDVMLNSITSAAGDSFNVIGEAFGSIISGDGIGSALAKAGQGLLGIVGGVLQEIGRQIIATSALVETLKNALDNLFGPGGTALGFAVGAALIGLGGLLKNIKFDLPKFQDGGITAGPASGFPAILHPNEAIIPLDKLPDIVGRLNSGGSNITLAPVVSFGYDRLYVGFKRTEEKRRRLG